MARDHDPRPELARLSERILKQEVRAYEELFTEAFEAVKAPLEGSRWLADRRRAEGNECAEGALGYAAEQFQRLMRSIRDHAEVIRLLMQHDRLLLVPSWTNTRAILEPVLLSCWLTDPDADSEARIARAASLMLGTIQGAITQLRKFSAQEDELQAKREARSELVDYYATCGFGVEWAQDKKGNPKDELATVLFEGRRVPLRHNITQQALKYVPDDPHLYGMLSGAAHGQTWLLNGLGGDADEAIRSIMVLLLPVSAAYTTAICGYLGLDPQPYAARRQTRLTALMTRGSAVGPGIRSSRDTAFGELSSGLRYQSIMRSQ